MAKPWLGNKVIVRTVRESVCLGVRVARTKGKKGIPKEKQNTGGCVGLGCGRRFCGSPNETSVATLRGRSRTPSAERLRSRNFKYFWRAFKLIFYTMPAEAVRLQ